MESNAIEDIRREPSDKELDEYDRFMALEVITVKDLEKFVCIYEPYAAIRTRVGNNVIVGGDYPPKGGPEIKTALKKLLKGLQRNPEDAWQTHLQYESLHPFNDCNGRSGRMIWQWQRQMSWGSSLGFLHTFYYQTLKYSSNREE